MHSMWKLQKYYPQINTTILRAFYGSADPMLNWDKNSWDEFNKIDLDEFFRKTMPDIKIFHCLFDSLNCTHIWKQRKTKLGICLGRVVVFARIEKGKLMLNTHLKNLTCTMKWRGSIFFIFRGSTSILPNIILALLLVRRKSVEIQLPILGLNKSDSTYGWYGQMLGIHLYYNYYTDQVEEESKAISLRKLLIQLLNLFFPKILHQN